MAIPQGRYEIIETLGTGATSRVDKARDTLIGRAVALKTFLHGLGSGDLQKRFLREAQIVGSLAHPYIVSLYDVGIDANGVPYFVMEYVEGKTLEQALDGGPLPLEKAAAWAANLAAALARAHQAKIIHGDVKPANILITKEGQVKLGDFGIARFATQSSGSGSLMGTPAYLSPEQILGHVQDTRSDLFSLGIILYQMTTGVRPFNGTSVGAVCAQIVSIAPPPPSQHNPALPPGFDRIVMRCLAKDPAERYATAEALSASLYPFARGEEAQLAIAGKVPSFNQALQLVQCWTATAAKTLGASLESLSRGIQARAAGAVKPFWWNRPMQRRDLWAVAVLIAISLLPIAHALWSHSRVHLVPAEASLSVATTTVGSQTATTPLSAVMINVGSSSVIDPAAVNPDTDPAPAGASASDPVDALITPPVVTRTFKRHPVPLPKPQPSRLAPTVSVTPGVSANGPSLAAGGSSVRKAPMDPAGQQTYTSTLFPP